MRLISSELVSMLKGATDACFRLGGGVTSFALLTRVGVSTLSKYASTGDEHADLLIPVDVAVEADQRAGSPVIVTEMARQLGFRLEPLEAVINMRRLTEADAHRVLSETMDVSRAILDATADGAVDALDWKVIEREAREAIRALEAVLASRRSGETS